MSYLPKFKQTKPKYTSGGEYRDSTTGQEYTGFYFTTSKGEAYTGTSMVRGQSKLLVRDTQRGDFDIQVDETAYDFIKKDAKLLDLRTTEELPTFTPERNDFSSYLVRYFAKRHSDGSIKEISQDTYKELKNETTKYHYPSYTVTYLTWYTTYPVEDIKNGSYIIKGSKNRNLEEISKAEKVMPGIVFYLADPTELIG